MVDTRDLKSLGQKWLYEFESRPRHQKNATALRLHSFLFLSQGTLFENSPGIMKRIILTVALAAMSFVGAFAQDVLGKWKLEDGSAIVEVYKEGDHYNGRVI